MEDMIIHSRRKSVQAPADTSLLCVAVTPCGPWGCAGADSLLGCLSGAQQVRLISCLESNPTCLWSSGRSHISQPSRLLSGKWPKHGEVTSLPSRHGQQERRSARSPWRGVSGTSPSPNGEIRSRFLCQATFVWYTSIGLSSKEGWQQVVSALRSQEGVRIFVADFILKRLTTLSHLLSAFHKCWIFIVCTYKLESGIFP